MISDVLFEALEEMDRYLNDPSYNDIYKGDLRQEILEARTMMANVLKILDAPPNHKNTKKK